MTRRGGARAGRDTGSTTGVATAVLALLSAGTLATLGVVTAGELRGVGPGFPVPGISAVDPPASVRATSVGPGSTPTTTRATGSGRSSARGPQARNPTPPRTDGFPLDAAVLPGGAGGAGGVSLDGGNGRPAGA